MITFAFAFVLVLISEPLFVSNPTQPLEFIMITSEKAADLHKVFVLLSGGVDSTTTLAMAYHEFPSSPIETVTVNYGQRHIKEKMSAEWQSAFYSATHVELHAQGMLTGMLVNKGDANEAIPNASYADLPHGISLTYVSFRNGFMLSLLAARAQSWVMEQEKKLKHSDMKVSATLYVGVHADDGANDAYPDCTLEFVGAMSNAIQVGTYGKVRLRAPLVHMDKSEVIRWGVRHDVDYSHTWSCYAGEEKHCGTCPTCRARHQAFYDAGSSDPTEYAVHPDLSYPHFEHGG